MAKLITKIEKGNARGLKDVLGKFEGKQVEIEIKKVKNIRSLKQNRALHLYFTLMAQELNSAGWDMKKVLKKEYDIPWTTATFKDNIWKPIMKTAINKQSTTSLTTNEIDFIYDIINRELGKKTGVSVQFPSIENLIDEYEKGNL